MNRLIDDEQLRDDNQITREKRASAPDGFGDECPVCGESFDAGSSGVVWSDLYNSTDVRAWVRLCTGPLPAHLTEYVKEVHDHSVESVPFSYVHKDEHIHDE